MRVERSFFVYGLKVISSRLRVMVTMECGDEFPTNTFNISPSPKYES
jgi:hypothetical protein